MGYDMLGLIRKFAQWPWPLLRISREVSNEWLNFCQASKAQVNEVTDTLLTANGVATITDGKMVSRPASVNNFVSTHPIVFAANENFYIRATVKFDVPGSSVVNLPVLGVYETTADAGTAWVILQGGPAHPSRQGYFLFSYKAADGSVVTVADTDVVAYGEPTTVEVVRVDGVIRLFLNGALKAQLAESRGNTSAVTVPMRAFKLSSAWPTSIASGEVYDVQIKKGDDGYPTATHAVPVLSAYDRVEYSPDVASKVVAQFGFRDNDLSNEAGTESFVLGTQASVVESRLNMANSSEARSYSLCRPWGSADFTVEFMVNLKSVSQTYGAVLLGQWCYGANTDDNNRWYLYVHPSRTVDFGLAKSATARDFVILQSSYVLPVNVDVHFVIERLAGVVTIYANGVAIATTDTLNFPIRSANQNFVGTLSTSGYHSAQYQIWNIRIVDKAIYKGEVRTKPTFPQFPREVKDPWYQFLFDGNAYDDVTGRPMSLTSATVMNGGLYTTSGYSSKATFGEFEVDAGEDFTIELKVNISSLGSGGGMLLGQWGDTATSNIAWAIYVVGSSRAVRWYQSSDGTNYSWVQTAKFLGLNTDHHIAVTRRSGKVGIFIDGKLEATLKNNDAFFNSAFPVGISWWNSNGFMNGKRWDIRFVRGQAKYIEDFEPKPLLPFVRRSYDLYEQQKVLRQFTFREGDTTDEISKSPVSLSGSSITNGAIRTTFASNSRFNLQAAYFGDGDFTVECKVNIARKSSYFYLLAQWYGGGTAISDSRNSWGLSVGDDMKPGFIFKANNVQNQLSSDIALQYNKDHHIVVERVDGVMNIYVDGVLGKSWANNAVLPVSTTALIANYALSGVGGYAEYSLRDIRIASGAMYKGKIPKLNYLPKPQTSVYLEASSIQALVYDQDHIEQEISDHYIEASSIQVLVKA